MIFHPQFHENSDFNELILNNCKDPFVEVILESNEEILSDIKWVSCNHNIRYNRKV